MARQRSEQADELVVITKALDLAREMTPRTRKLPRGLPSASGGHREARGPYAVVISCSLEHALCCR